MKYKNVESIFLKSIQAALDNVYIENEKVEGMKWEDIRKEAKAQELSGLAYSALNEKCKLSMDEKVLDKWKRLTLHTAITQLRHIKQVENILKELQQASVQVIVLKGLVVRELYPRPELRTMSDADMLVHEKDIDVVERVLLDRGYTAQERNKLHIRYTHKVHKPIEVHWTLRHEGVFEKINIREQELWERAIEHKIGNVSALALDTGDLMLHLCTHMATHLVLSGFGLRQVVDLGLVVRTHRDEIEWKRFCHQVGEWELEMFVLTLFYAMERLIGVKVPSEINNLGKVDEKAVDLLVRQVLEGGTRGRKSLHIALGNTLAMQTNGKKEGLQNNGSKNFMKFLFPKAQDMSEEYDWVKKNKCFLPLAWMHRLCFAKGNKQYSFRERVEFIIRGKRSTKKKIRLLALVNLEANREE